MNTHPSKPGIVVTLACALTILCSASLSAQAAQSGVQLKEDKPGQLAQAKITPDAARKIALARVAKGVIIEQGIEEEDGKLVFSFDIQVPGKSGIEEVLVDAKNGKVVSQEHESPADIAKEKVSDAKEAKAAAAKAKKPPR